MLLFFFYITKQIEAQGDDYLYSTTKLLIFCFILNYYYTEIYVGKF